MGVIENVKEIANIVRQIDNIELYRQIVDLQGEVVGLVEENGRLKHEVANLKEKLTVKGKLVVKDDCYWLPDDSGNLDGPFCTTCWDTEKQLVRMLHMGQPAVVSCTIHKRSINVGGWPPPRVRPFGRGYE